MASSSTQRLINRISKMVIIGPKLVEDVGGKKSDKTQNLVKQILVLNIFEIWGIFFGKILTPFW